MKEPRIRAAAASGLMPLLAMAGLDPDEVVGAAGLDPADVSDPEAWLPVRGFVALFELAAERIGDPLFGLRVGLAQSPEQLGVIGYVIVNSPTAGAAFDNLVRYLATHQEGVDLRLEREGDLARFVYRIADPAIQPRRQDAELTMGVGTAILRAVFGEGYTAEEVWFEHGPLPERNAQAKLLRCPVRFGRETNALVIRAADLDRALPSPDPTLLTILSRHAEATVAEQVGATLGAQVRAAIAERLRDGVPGLDTIGRTLGLSGATLRRRLDDERSSFQGELEAARRALAERYLSDPTLTLTETAFLLGYSEASAFNRAFKRWTGVTPGAFRRAALA